MSELYMKFDTMEMASGETSRWAQTKMDEVDDHQAKVDRLGAHSWTSEDHRGASEAVRQHSNRVHDNAGTQLDLARKTEQAKEIGVAASRFSQQQVNSLM
jgi:hypothetical protein